LHLPQNEPTGVYYARAKVYGKLVRRKLGDESHTRPWL
jgi:hypothetical protein